MFWVFCACTGWSVADCVLLFCAFAVSAVGFVVLVGFVVFVGFVVLAVFVVSVEAIFIHKHTFLDHPNVCIRVYYRCLRSVQAGKLASLLELRMHFIGAL